MATTSLPDSPLSIGYLAPGWPLDAFPNGVVSCVADMADQLSRVKHRVTVVANYVEGSNADPTIYNLHQARYLGVSDSAFWTSSGIGLPRSGWRIV